MSVSSLTLDCATKMATTIPKITAATKKISWKAANILIRNEVAILKILYLIVFCMTQTSCSDSVVSVFTQNYGFRFRCHAHYHDDVSYYSAAFNQATKGIHRQVQLQITIL